MLSNSNNLTLVICLHTFKWIFMWFLMMNRRSSRINLKTMEHEAKRTKIIRHFWRDIKKLEIIRYFDCPEYRRIKKRAETEIIRYLEILLYQTREAKNWGEINIRDLWNHFVSDYQGTERIWKLMTEKGDHNHHLRLPCARL